MTSTTTTIKAPLPRIVEIADNIRTAFGFTAGNARWREVYPCGFAVSFYCGSYIDYDDPLRFPDFTDLADLFVALTTVENQS